MEDTEQWGPEIENGSKWSNGNSPFSSGGGGGGGGWPGFFVAISQQPTPSPAKRGLILPNKGAISPCGNTRTPNYTDGFIFVRCKATTIVCGWKEGGLKSMEGSVVTSIARRTGLRFGREAMFRCHVESVVRGFRVRYNSAVPVAEKEKDTVKKDIEAVLIVCGRVTCRLTTQLDKSLASV